MARKSLKALLVVIGTMVLWSPGATAGQKKMTPLDIPMIGDIEMLKPGDKAPDFTLEDIEGRPFQLSKEAPQRVHLLVFWSIFCEPCKAEMPLIERLYEEYRDKGFEVIAVALDGEPMKKSIVGLVKQQGYKFRVFIDKLAPDESFVVADPYGVAGTPTLYLVGRDAKIAFAEVGLTDKDVLEAEIRKSLGR